MIHRHSFVAAAAFVLAAAVFGARASAQCSTSWLPSLPLPGVDGVVNAITMWDPDGVGPANPVAVVGGRFSIAGSLMTDHLATYDPATGVWSSLGAIAGYPWANEVRALAVMPNGDLVVAGLFATIGGVTVNSIARWNGSVWSALGAGFLEGRVHALAVMPNGDLVAGGDFVAAWGGFDLVARWNGTTWSSIGPGIPTSWWENGVRALAVLPNGDLVAGGKFWLDGPVPCGCLARWDGIRWSALGGTVDLDVYALVVAPNGDLFAGGQFSIASMGWAQVARWDGVTWSSVGQWPFFYEPVRSLALLPNGDLLAGAATYGGIARWNGTAWSGLGAGIHGSVNALAVQPNGELFAGGQFEAAGTVGARSIARWDGTTWSGLGPGFSGSVLASVTMPNGDLVVGGNFLSIGAIPAAFVARHDGVSWTPLGTGLPGPVSALAVLPNGDLVAGGIFGSFNVARWDGTTWHPMGTPVVYYGPLVGRVYALAVLPNGDLVAGGSTNTSQAMPLWRWNGSTWSTMGGVYDVKALLVLPNGDLLAVGGYPHWVKRFDGATWTNVGHAFNSRVHALVRMPNGDLVAGGEFTSLAFSPMYALARFDGVAWKPLGELQYGSSVDALEVLPGGDLVVGGSFVTAPVADPLYYAHQWGRIGRWNGTSWVPMPELSGGPVATLKMSGTELVVGGEFTKAGSAVGPYFARLATSCPANVISFGSGCTGSGGPNVLTAKSLPWVGSTFSAAATGMPANGVALVLTGYGTAAIPLSAILPQGGAGCFLLAAPDAIGMALPAGGAVATALAIPAAAGLIGQVFHQQVVPVELGSLGAITALTSTNRVTALIGSF